MKKIEKFIYLHCLFFNEKIMKKFSSLFLLLFLFWCSMWKEPVETNTSPSFNSPQKIISTQTWPINNVETVEKVQWPNLISLYKMADSKDLVSLEKALEKEDKTNVDILKLYWKLRFEQKRYEEAIDYFEKVNKAFEGKDSDSLYLIWMCYFNIWNLNKAKEFNDKSLILKPDYFYAKELQKKLDILLKAQNAK